MILHAEFRKKSPPLEGRVVVTWAAARSAEIFFLGLLLPPPRICCFEPRGKILTGETNEHNETNLLKGFLSQEEKYLLKKRTTQ